MNTALSHTLCEFLSVDAASSTRDAAGASRSPSVMASAATFPGSAAGAPTSLPAPAASDLRSFSHTHTFAAAAERAIQFSSSINSTE